MLALRWVLGLLLGGIGGGFLLLMVVGSGFRKSFGASEISPMLQLLPIAAMVVLFAGLIAPSNRLLLHIGAASAVAVMGYCVWAIIYESATVLWLVLVYLVMWLYFYWRSVNPGGVIPLATP